MNEWYRPIIIILLLALQHFLSTRSNRYLGSVLPIIYLAALLFGGFTGSIEGVMQVVLLIVVGEAVLLYYWVIGRKTVSNKRKRELEKMKTMDIK
ncbi:hypothetical protein [Peribacillus sp. NPDC097295]|uniref:hypothetical protein n=1 Tax=Peribacillus sp. NPDC097295 TaxID=3364402 RepID=UPI003825F7C5